MTNGIILGYNTVPNTENTDLQLGDLVQRLDGYDNNYYTIKKINKSVQYPYFLKSRHNSELVNFHRKELVKCHYAFFDYEKYFSEGKMKLLGLILLDDLNHIKAKRANDLEIGWSQLNTIGTEELLGLKFYGKIIKKQILEDSDFNILVATSSVLKYFKIHK